MTSLLNFESNFSSQKPKTIREVSMILCKYLLNFSLIITEQF